MPLTTSLVLLKEEIRSLSNEIQNGVLAINSLEELEDFRLRYLGKEGKVIVYLKQLSKISDLEERKEVSSILNSLKDELKSVIKDKKDYLTKLSIDLKLKAEKIDISLPVRPENKGKIHPISKVINEVKNIFCDIGFNLVSGPEIESEYYVFDALNTPKHHPARDLNDTFYLKNSLNGEKLLLRTHTSSMQIRAMEENNSFPIKIIAPGKVYRNDWDATHSPMFHQLEGLYIDTNVNMGHLKFCINYFLNRFFDKKVTIRFRNSFFPFTEPSAEVDISWNKGWMEILGCGMVHPNVLKNVGIDSTKYSGFAFGMGIERIAMLKYGIEDLRDFYHNDTQWLSHYGFCFTSLK